MAIFDRLPLWVPLGLALTLGLAPFVGIPPFEQEPHVWQKLKMLADGALSNPIDILDLGIHGFPWLLLALKLASMPGARGRSG